MGALVLPNNPITLSLSLSLTHTVSSSGPQGTNTSSTTAKGDDIFLNLLEHSSQYFKRVFSQSPLAPYRGSDILNSMEMLLGTFGYEDL
jgi:hypothetical protein